MIYFIIHPYMNRYLQVVSSFVSFLQDFHPILPANSAHFLHTCHIFLHIPDVIFEYFYMNKNKSID